MQRDCAGAVPAWDRAGENSQPHGGYERFRALHGAARSAGAAGAKNQLPGWPIAHIGYARGRRRRPGRRSREIEVVAEHGVSSASATAPGPPVRMAARDCCNIRVASSVIVTGVALLRRCLCGLEAAAGVQPKAAIDFKAGLGTGRGEFSRLAELAPRRNRLLADENRESGVSSGANAHYLLCPVDADRREFARLREHRTCHQACGPSTDIGRFEPGSSACRRSVARTEAADATPRAASLRPKSAPCAPGQPCDTSTPWFRLDAQRGARLLLALSWGSTGAHRGRKTAAPQGGRRNLYAGA